MNDNKTAPRCPNQLELKHLLEQSHKGFNELRGTGIIFDSSESESIHNALRYLDNMLSNRRGYQKKQQIKRGLLRKLATEQGFMQEIEDAAQAKLGKTLDELSEEDVD